MCVRDGGGEVILYQWVEFLREYLDQKSQTNAGKIFFCFCFFCHVMDGTISIQAKIIRSS